MSYDQWKTASPYDDEPDPVEEAEKWLEAHGDNHVWTPITSINTARTVIEMLLAYIKDEI